MYAFSRVSIRLARLFVPGAVSLALLATACAPAAPPAPTAAPAKPTEAPAAKPAEKAEPKPAASPAAKPAEAKPAASPAAKPAEQPAAKVSPAAKFDEKAVVDFYRGKTVRIIVGFAPGGAYDTYSRLVAKQLPRFIPGNPSVIVENRAGAGSLLAANQVYATEAKDGTVVGSFNENLVLQQALGAQGIQFDAARFNWLGSVEAITAWCGARVDTGVKDIQEVIQGKEVVLGTTSPGTSPHDTPAVINAALGTRFKLVPGYEGANRIILAIENKEVEGYCSTVDSPQGAHLYEGPNPTLKILVVMGDTTPDAPHVRGVPAAETLAKTDEARQLLRAVYAPGQMSRPFAVAPEVPRDRIEALRTAFASTFADQQFVAEVRQAQRALVPKTGEEVSRIAQQVIGLSPNLVAKLKEALK